MRWTEALDAPVSELRPGLSSWTTCQPLLLCFAHLVGHMRPVLEGHDDGVLRLPSVSQCAQWLLLHLNSFYNRGKAGPTGGLLTRLYLKKLRLGKGRRLHPRSELGFELRSPGPLLCFISSTHRCAPPRPPPALPSGTPRLGDLGVGLETTEHKGPCPVIWDRTELLWQSECAEEAAPVWGHVFPFPTRSGSGRLAVVRP